MSDARTLIERIFNDVFNAGNMDLIDELFTEDYVDHGPMGDLAGRDALKAVMSAWRAAIPDVHCEVSHVFSDGDMVGWVVRTTGTHTGDQLGFPATGKRFDTLAANVGRMRDGKATEHWSEQGMFPFLVQIGIIPAPAGAPA